MSNNVHCSTSLTGFLIIRPDLVWTGFVTPEHSLGADAGWGQVECLKGQLVVLGL